MIKYLNACVVSASKQMNELEESGSLKGPLSAEQQLALISVCTDLKAAVEGATFIQVSQALTAPSRQVSKTIKSCAGCGQCRVAHPDPTRTVVLVKVLSSLVS